MCGPPGSTFFARFLWAEKCKDGCRAQADQRRQPSSGPLRLWVLTMRTTEVPWGLLCLPGRKDPMGLWGPKDSSWQGSSVGSLQGASLPGDILGEAA